MHNIRLAEAWRVAEAIRSNQKQSEAIRSIRLAEAWRVAVGGLGGAIADVGAEDSCR